jgi:glyoxylase-like metal-dependent hydrolase (beta-lactamase superfamily II)
MPFDGQGQAHRCVSAREDHVRIGIAIAAAVAGLVLTARDGGVAAQSGGSGLELITRIAEALGGKARILALKTLTIEGYGQLAYQNGGGNITSSIDAPQKWMDVNDYVRVTDLEHGRSRVRQRQVNDFVFALAQSMKGVVNTQAIDGEVAFNLSPTGAATRASAAVARARRMEGFAHPVVIVHMALNPKSTVGNRRTSGALELVDVTSPLGDRLTLAVHSASSLPAWVSWVGPDGNLGDVTYRAAFTGYEPVSGVLMPTGFNTTIDFRSIVQQKLYVDRQAIDAPIPDLSAPAAVRAAPAPVPQAPMIEATAIAKGIWFLRGAGNSVLFEFDDHLTLFEVYASEANAKAVIDKARSLVPAKPLTEAIISHHHFDHTGGLRTAVAEGLTIVMQRGNEAFIRDVTSRPARLFPDALGRAPKPLKMKTVDDHLKLKDSSMEIDVYRVVANSHMADGLMVYVPRDRLLVQGDLFDIGWDVYWWGSSYMDNVQYRKLQVDRDVPVHGRILPIAEVQQAVAKQIANAQALCASVEAAGLSMRGCPVKTTVDR